MIAVPIHRISVGYIYRYFRCVLLVDSEQIHTIKIQNMAENIKVSDMRYINGFWTNSYNKKSKYGRGHIKGYIHR